MKLSPRAALWLIVAILVFGAALRLHSVSLGPSPTSDEARYAHLGEVAVDEGIPGLQRESAEFQPTGRFSHFETPSTDRVGYFLLRGWFVHIFPVTELTAGEWLSAWLDIATLVLLAWGTWRLLGPLAAVVATMLYAVCPPVLVMARHGWQESFITLLGLAMLFCAERGARTGWRAAALLTALTGFGLCVKATLLADGLMLCAVVFVARVLRRLPVAKLLGCFAASMVLAAWWLSRVLGGWSQISFFITRESQQKNWFAIAYQTGTPADWFHLLWVSDPFMILLAVAGAIWILTSLARGREEWFSLATFSFIAAWASVLLPLSSAYGLNLRYSALAYAPMCILAAIFVARLGPWAAATLRPGALKLATAACALYLLFAAIQGVSEFRTRFEKTDMQELSLRYVLPQGQQP